MKNNIDLNKLPDDYLISYYQDLMFNLAKSSKDLQDIFLQAYYNLQDATQNRIINKFNLYAILGFSAIKLFGGFDEINDISPYLLSLIIASYNFVAGKYNRAKIISNKNFFQKFILKNIADQYLEIAAMCEDDSVMERVLNCMDKAFYNILLSEKHMIRIQNYKYMSKLKQTTNNSTLNEKVVNDGLILLAKSILKNDTNKTEFDLKELATKGDLCSIIFYYLAKPKFSTKAIDDIVMNIPSEDSVNYPVFMAMHLSGLYPQEFIKTFKHTVEKKFNRSIFTEKNGKYTDFGAFCECAYVESSTEENLTEQDLLYFKKAEKYLTGCKTELAFFYKSYLKAIYEKGKKQKNGKAAIKNFAQRGLSTQILEPEKITLKNIYVEKEYSK